MSSIFFVHVLTLFWFLSLHCQIGCVHLVVLFLGCFVSSSATGRKGFSSCSCSCSLLELPEELLRLEVLRDGLVEALDDLVDLLLPAGLDVLALAHRDKELPQGGLHHRQEVVGNLKQEEGEVRVGSSFLFS